MEHQERTESQDPSTAWPIGEYLNPDIDADDACHLRHAGLLTIRLLRKHRFD
jgi:hypothetical protein